MFEVQKKRIFFISEYFLVKLGMAFATKALHLVILSGLKISYFTRMCPGIQLVKNIHNMVHYLNAPFSDSNI
jgi:hypothetical protein